MKLFNIFKRKEQTSPVPHESRMIAEEVRLQHERRLAEHGGLGRYNAFR